MRRFFDDYPVFFETSGTGYTPHRLNRRHEILIESNLEILRGKTVLDLSSHDGRWSFAALMAGAEYVLGLEGRKELVESAYNNMEQYRIPKDRYEFQIGDLHEALRRMQQPFDVVLCFGFLYHTPFHLQLFSDMTRLSRSCIIIDTAITPAVDSIIRFSYDRTSNKRNSIDYTSRDKSRAIVGYPSRSLIEMALSHFGFGVRYLDWHRQGIIDWHEIADYRSGRRVSLVASKDGGEVVR